MIKKKKIYHRFYLFYLTQFFLIFNYLSISTTFATKPAQTLSISGTIPPLCLILKEILIEPFELHCLLRPGFSPHDYDPLPSEMKMAMNAKMHFYISSNFDGWIKSSQLSLELLPLVAKSDLIIGIEGDDPHFWIDPLIVNTLLEPMALKLCHISGAPCELFIQRQKAFTKKLLEIHKKIESDFLPLKGKALLTTHPYVYYLKRYWKGPYHNIEKSSHNPPTPKWLKESLDWGKLHQPKIILTTPQSPKKYSESIAQTLSIKLLEADPLQAESYEKLLLQITQKILLGFKE